MAAACVSTAGIIVGFVYWWRRMRVAWQKPRPSKTQPLESTGELCGYAIGFLGLAVSFGPFLVDQMQRGAPLRMTMFLLVTFALLVFVSGVSLGRLFERLAVRRQQRLGDAPPNGEAWES
jgi:hypothetical protein